MQPVAVPPLASADPYFEHNVLVQGVPFRQCSVKTRSVTVSILYSIVSTAGEGSRAAYMCYFNLLRIFRCGNCATHASRA